MQPRKILTDSEIRKTIDEWLPKSSFWSDKSDHVRSKEEERVKVIAKFTQEEVQAYKAVIYSLLDNPFPTFIFHSNALEKILTELQQQESFLTNKSLQLQSKMADELKESQSREAQQKKEIELLRQELESLSQKMKEIKLTQPVANPLVENPVEQKNQVHSKKRRAEEISTISVSKSSFFLRSHAHKAKVKVKAKANEQQKPTKVRSKKECTKSTRKIR